MFFDEILDNNFRHNIDLFTVTEGFNVENLMTEFKS